MILTTVNVVEIIESAPSQISSFRDNTDGNKEAETLFVQMVKELGAKEEDIESYIEDGVFTYGEHDAYGVYITHST